MKKILPRLLELGLSALLLTATAGRAALVPTEWRHRQELHVAAPGVVRVELPDATFDAAEPDLGDLRLLDPAGRETAFVTDRPTPVPDRIVRPASFAVRIEDGNTVMLLKTGTADARVASVALETPHPHFLRAARIETSPDGADWSQVDEGAPLFRQWGAEKLTVPAGQHPAAWIRLTVHGATVPFTGAALTLAAGTAPEPVPVGARLVAREEFSGETILTVALDGRHAPLAALELDTPDPLFMRRVTVAVRDVRDLVAGERTIGSGTLYRVALDGAPVRAQLRLDFNHVPSASELLVHIHNGDSPPLTVTGVRILREPVSLLFNATAAGTHTLLSGNAQARPPRYDLASFVGQMQAARATTVTPGPLQATPGYQPRASLAEPPLPDVPLTGAPLDAEGWTRRKPVQIAAPGVQELELDPAALAGARTDLADLRLRRGGHQIPYLLERTGLARPLTLTPEWTPDTRRPTVSVWRLQLPHAGLPLLRLALASDTPLFERHFRIYEKLISGDGRAYEHTHATGTWSRTPEPGSPRTRVFDLGGRVQGDTLWVETDNGDNPPIVLAGAKAEHAVVRLVFRTDGTDGCELLYGNERAAAPRYDLGLVARPLLTAGRSPARLGAEETDPEGFARGMLRHLRGGAAFWSALGLVVVVLLVVVARLLPKAEAPK